MSENSNTNVFYQVVLYVLALFIIHRYKLFSWMRRVVISFFVQHSTILIQLPKLFGFLTK